MVTIYEAHAAYPTPTRDFDDEDEARRYVEAAGEGYVVTFVRGFDGCDRSAAMSKYENSAWRGLSIHE